TELPKYLQENNFDVVRGKGKTAEKNIKDIHEFKIKNLEKVEKQLNDVKIDLEAHRQALNKINDITLIKTSKTILGGNIKVKQQEYEKIVQGYKNLLNENIILSKENENLKSENKNINKKLNNAMNEIKSFNYTELNFERKRKELKEELIESINQDYDEKINNLKDKIKDVYKTLNENNKTVKQLTEKNKNLEYERDFEEKAAERLANFLRAKKMMKEYNEFYEKNYKTQNKSNQFSM
ncbi:hypothetical protein, partial [Clostridium tarantellae]|uniref:hypothetical protein n=1 Tax=Clostridium tarantellae TaxID=39493 RepID=UPI0014781164